MQLDDVLTLVPAVPETERAAARDVESAVALLGRQVADFRSALRLFDHSLDLQATIRSRLDEIRRENVTIETLTMMHDERRSLRDEENTVLAWTLIAARSAVFSVFHFGDAFDRLRPIITLSPTLERNFNELAFKKAQASLDKYFQDREIMRHAVGHSAEIAMKIDKNIVKGRVKLSKVKSEVSGEVFLQESLVGRTFVTMRNKQLLKFDITQQNFERLLEIYGQVVGSFDAVRFRWGDGLNSPN